MALKISFFIITISFRVYLCIEDEYFGLARDWCNVSACGGYEDTHLLCLFPDLTHRYIKDCKNSKTVKTMKYIQKVIDFHNDFRNKWAIQKWPEQKKYGFPKASNMRLLHYDYELEAINERLVINCAIDFPTCTQLDRFKPNRMGTMKKSTNKSMSDIHNTFGLLKWWTTQINDTKPEVMKRYDEALIETGYLTQLVWADITSVACGESHFSYDRHYDDGTVEPWFGSLFNCLYAPLGFQDYEPVYIEGFPGENCPIGTVIAYDPRYPFLCGGDTNISDILFELTGGANMDNIPNRTTVEYLSKQSNIVSNARLITFMSYVVILIKYPNS